MLIVFLQSYEEMVPTILTFFLSYERGSVEEHASLVNRCNRHRKAVSFKSHQAMSVLNVAANE